MRVQARRCNEINHERIILVAMYNLVHVCIPYTVIYHSQGGGGGRDDLKFQTALYSLLTLYTTMYFDLFVPFPLPQNLDTAPKKGKKDKGKGKQVPGQVQEVKVEEKKEYWPSITQLEKERCTRSIALAGHRTSIHTSFTRKSVREKERER